MKITGIIAEYNPFHNGHAYQIAKIKEETDSDYVIVAMSGDFVQRGEPAITDKYERARMALSCGADLVLELPALFACASAEYFARAGVALFTRMGCIDYLCFGAENADLSQLNKIAGILADEPRSYQDALNRYLKEGKNFPAARILALKSYLSAESSDAALQTEQLTSLLSTPNNILGIEYLKALKTCGSQITPYPILREGAGYHDTDILLKNASASAIRQTLKQAGSSGSSSGSAPDFASFSAAMPQEAFQIFSEYLASSTYLEADDFSGILNYLLLFYPAEALACFADCNIEIANRLKKNRSAFSSFTQFAALNQSRDITYARMSRIFTHILLHMTAEDYKQAKQLGYVPYLRPLGFKQPLRQHKTERTPHIAPVFFIGVNGVLHQIVGVLASRVREAGRIQLCAAAAVAVVDLDRTARRTSAVAAIGIARDHRVDVRGVFLVLVGDSPAELRGKVFIRCRQRERHSGDVGFLMLDRTAILQLRDHNARPFFGDIKAVHKTVCRALARRTFAKAERIENRLDLYRVKTIAVGHSRVGFRHRRIQKRKSRLHIRDVRLKLGRHGIRKVDSIERRFDCQIVVVGPTCRV